MCFPVSGFDAFERTQFREDQLQQSTVVEELESDRRHRGEHDFVHLGDDTLLGDDVDSFPVAANGGKGLIFDIETQLCGKSDCPNHAQWIVRESGITVTRGADDVVLQIVHAVERIDQLAEGVGIE